MIKTMRFEIRRLTDKSLDQERRKVWSQLAQDATGITNCFWLTWFSWHQDRGAFAKLKRWREETIAWHENGRKGKKPKYPIKAMPSECDKAVRQRIATIAPHIHSRPRNLIQQRLVRTLSSLKPSERRGGGPKRGGLSWWAKVLLYEEHLPGSTEPQPIPFDRENAMLLEPANRDGDWLFEFRVELQKKGKAIKDRVQLYTHGSRRISARHILHRIFNKEYEMRGSQLGCRKGKWFVFISYKMPDPEHAELDANRSAVLLPGRTDPWLLKINGSVYYRGGTGLHIAAIRKRIIQERRERQENYRWANSSQRGHGRGRATATWTRFRNLWTNACTNYNRHVAKAIIGECVRCRVGKLEYWQPEDSRGLTRFLGNAGKVDGYRDQMSYPWFQMKTILEQRCEESGVELVIRKFGARKGAAETDNDE